MTKALDPGGGRDHQVLSRLVSPERLSSYLSVCGDDIGRAFALYEWNMSAAAAVMHTAGMVEVVVRNAMDRCLRGLAEDRGWSSWLDQAPLDVRGRSDVAKARVRASRPQAQPEVHGKVVAELSLGFWRYLAASRYLTSLWIPSLHAAFGYAQSDKRQARREVEQRLQTLLLVRNRSAHHEPIHRRDLQRDLDAAVQLAAWVDPEAGRWVADMSLLPDVLARRPTP